jgi:hypothetical protein
MGSGERHPDGCCRAWAACEVTVKRILILAALAAISLAAQEPLPSQAVGGGLHYDQSANPSAAGFVFYAKQVSGNFYSFTQIRTTSVKLKPTAQIETCTETGGAEYISAFGGLKLWAVGTGGACVSGSKNGSGAAFGATGTGMATKALGKGFFAGVYGSIAYSAATSTRTYPVGVLIGWGGK